MANNTAWDFGWALNDGVEQNNTWVEDDWALFEAIESWFGFSIEVWLCQVWNFFILKEWKEEGGKWWWWVRMWNGERFFSLNVFFNLVVWLLLWDAILWMDREKAKMSTNGGIDGWIEKWCEVSFVIRKNNFISFWINWDEVHSWISKRLIWA